VQANRSEGFFMVAMVTRPLDTKTCPWPWPLSLFIVLMLFLLIRCNMQKFLPVNCGVSRFCKGHIWTEEGGAE
jgi:hypothetical protein